MLAHSRTVVNAGLPGSKKITLSGFKRAEKIAKYRSNLHGKSRLS
jgi:hypothetical protein